MGYSTQFNGELKFTNDLKGSELAYLKQFLSKDRRDIGFKTDSVYEKGKYGSYWYHIDYELTDDLSGIRWNGAEKAYDMEHIANWLIDKMREEYPSFGLSGMMTAQGEDFLDRWNLVIEKGRAVKKKVIIEGTKIVCPHCDEIVIVEEAKNY